METFSSKFYNTASPSPPAIDPIQVPPPPPPQISRPNMYAPNYNVTDPNRATNANGVMTPQYGIMPTFPVHPDVRLKKLAFYDILGTLIKPSTLLPGNNQRLQEGTFPFYLSPQQATDIASNRDIRNVAKPEYTIQVQLRFCLLETSCEQEDYFPPNVVVKVNSKLCQLPVSRDRV
jgi:PINIT domain